jgi:hypothetical protein
MDREVKLCWVDIYFEIHLLSFKTRSIFCIPIKRVMY